MTPFQPPLNTSWFDPKTPGALSKAWAKWVTQVSAFFATPVVNSPFSVDSDSGVAKTILFTSAGVPVWDAGVDASGNFVVHRYGTGGTSPTAAFTLSATTPSVTGSRGGNLALASLLTKLAGDGLIVDGSTA